MISLSKSKTTISHNTGFQQETRKFFKTYIEDQILTNNSLSKILTSPFHYQFIVIHLIVRTNRVS